MLAETTDKTEHCNCFAARSAERHITQLYDRYLAPVGLRTTQFSILARLKRKAPLMINSLASSMVMDRTTLGRNVQPLERDGLITVETSVSDRRAKVVRLTRAEEKRLQAVLIAWSQAQKRFESDLGGKRVGRNARLNARRRTELVRADGTFHRTLRAGVGSREPYPNRCIYVFIRETNWSSAWTPGRT
jgi:DNA-binding MarR family transcriptional regulator